MIAKISVFVICVEAIIYLLLYDLNDCTFKRTFNFGSIRVIILLQCRARVWFPQKLSSELESITGRTFLKVI